MDKDGYPESRDLRKIRIWDYKDFEGLMDYFYDIWKYADYGFWKKGRK